MFTYFSPLQKKIALGVASLFLVVGLFTAPMAHTAQAGWPVTDVGNAGTHGTNAGSQASNTAATWKDFALQMLKQVGMAIAKVLLNKMTEATVNWINGGFQGSPKFIENPKSFFKDIGDTQLKNLVDTIGYNAAQFPYGREVAKLLIYDSIYDRSDFKNKAKSTLYQVIGSEWNKFSSDFGKGGWEGYDAYATNPANNPFGMLFLGTQEASKQVAKGTALVEKEVAQGQGFLSQKTCTNYRNPPPQTVQEVGTGPTTIEAPTTSSGQQVVTLNQDQGGGNVWGGGGSGFTPPDNTPATPSGTSTTGTTGGTTGGSTTTGGNQNLTQNALNNEHQFLLGGAQTDADCLEWKQLSPGSVVQSQINKALGSKASQGELAQALGNSLSSIINALTTSLLNKGLSALSTIGQNDTVDSSVWSYDGLTLSGIPTNSLSGDNWASAADKYVNFQELFYIGQDAGLTDDNGIPIRTTIIEQAERQVAAYKALVRIITGDQVNPSFAGRIRQLDYAVPGPKMGWERRLGDKIATAQQRWSQKAQTLTIKKNKENAAEIADLLGDLTTEMPQQIKLQLLSANILSYPDAQALIRSSRSFSAREDQYVESYTDSLATLSRLKNIKSRLDLVIANNTSSLYTASTIDTDLEQFLAEHPGTIAPTPNPFNYLDGPGIQTLKSITKAYGLLEKDLPNTATIADAESTYAQVKAQYDNITITLNQILQEKNLYMKDNIYKVTFGGRKDKFIQVDQNLPQLFPKIDPATLSQTVLAQIKSLGYSQISPLEYYISPLGGTADIPGITDANVSGFSQLTINTTITKSQILAEFSNTYASGSMDAEHQSALASLSDSNLTLAYALVTTSLQLQDMGDGWDNTATGSARLQNAIDLVADYDAATDAPVNEKAETIFYCQSILDYNDKQDFKARGVYLSLFKRPKVDIKCSKIYNSSESDYKITQ